MWKFRTPPSIKSWGTISFVCSCVALGTLFLVQRFPLSDFMNYRLADTLSIFLLCLVILLIVLAIILLFVDYFKKRHIQRWKVLPLVVFLLRFVVLFADTRCQQSRMQEFYESYEKSSYCIDLEGWGAICADPPYIDKSPFSCLRSKLGL